MCLVSWPNLTVLPPSPSPIFSILQKSRGFPQSRVALLQSFLGIDCTPTFTVYITHRTHMLSLFANHPRYVAGKDTGSSVKTTWERVDLLATRPLSWSDTSWPSYPAGQMNLCERLHGSCRTLVPGPGSLADVKYGDCYWPPFDVHYPFSSSPHVSTRPSANKRSCHSRHYRCRRTRKGE